MDSIIKRAFSPFAVVLRAITLTLVICATTSAWAEDRVNPVTGETEPYSNIFTGATDSEWNCADNWTLANDGKKPFVSSGDYNAALVDGNMTVSTDTAIDGYQLRVGAYNGAAVTWSGGITKIQAGSTGCWLTADETSSITIASFAGNQLEGSSSTPFKLYSANAGGITWSAGLSKSGGTQTLPFHYYLLGEGTVVYNGTLSVSAPQVIKQADVTLVNSAEDTRTVERKKLVAFTSCSATFTADATISVGGTVTATKTLTWVTQNATSLTTSSNPGTCELVQISSGENAGLWLYYVENGVPPCPTWTAIDLSPYSMEGNGGIIGPQLGNWSSNPSSGDNVIFDISEDSTLYLESPVTFGTVTICSSTATKASPVTFTIKGQIAVVALTASQVIVGENIILKIESPLSGDVTQMPLSAPVQLKYGARFDIDVPLTWSQVISGIGGVRVLANAVTFSTANTFTGGLTVANGGQAKTSNNNGFGSSSSGTNGEGTITVESGGTLDVANTAGASYTIRISGTGVGGIGAIRSSTRIGAGQKQAKGITLLGDATIDCSADWGLIGSGWTTATSLDLGTYTLTKTGSGNFWICKTTITGSGTIDVAAGKICTIKNESEGENAKILIEAGSEFVVSSTGYDGANGSDIKIKTVECASGTEEYPAGGKVTVSSKTLTIKNGGTLTANGTVNVEGTGRINIGWSGSAGSHLVVGGTVNVNGAGDGGKGILLVSTSDIKKNGSGVINIASGALVEWVNCNWTDKAGDIFRGLGTLHLHDWGIQDLVVYPNGSGSLFEGTLKISLYSTGKTVKFDGNVEEQFKGLPTLTLNLGTEGGTLTDMRLINSSANKSLKVKDLSGHGKIYPWVSTTGTYTIDTFQAHDTTFAGEFACWDSSANKSASLVVHGDTEISETKSLTLSGGNTTKGTATVKENAKLIFSSTGSWASGTVTVDDGGYLEVANSSSVATALNLSDGGTLVLTLDSESAEVPVTAGTVNLAASGTVYVDLSAWSFVENETKTIISATTLSAANIASVMRPVSGNYVFAVDGNNITATRMGACTWTSGEWSYSPTLAKEGALVNVSGDQTLALTDSLEFQSLAFSGSGTITISSSGATLFANTITIGDGVTVIAFDGMVFSGMTINNSGSSGTGKLQIPEGASCEMEDATCTAIIYCYGNLNTRGDVDLRCTGSSWSIYYASSKLTVETGECKIRCEEKGLKGDVEICADAILTESRGYDDGLDFGSSNTIDIKGKLDMGSQRWTIGASNEINMYEDSQVVGTVANNGCFDWKDVGCVLTVKGNATIDANLRARDSYGAANVEINVYDGKTLTVKKPFATSNATGIITKTGGGTLKLQDVMRNSAGNSTEPTIAGSEGTVEFYSSSDHRYLNRQVTFSGKVKFTQASSKEVVVNSTTLFTNRPSLEVSGGFTMHSNLAADNVSLNVSDLSGSGTVSPKFGEQTTARIVDTQQTTETTFDGNFSHHVSNNSNDRKTGLTVRSNGSTVHGLTLTKASDTTGPLSVLDYGKVIFADSGSNKGSWANGNVTVGENGWLASSSTATTVAGSLTVSANGGLVYTGTPIMTDSVSLPAGTVKIDISAFPAGTYRGAIVSSAAAIDITGVTFAPAEAGALMGYVVNEDDRYVLYVAKPGTIFSVY